MEIQTMQLVIMSKSVNAINTFRRLNTQQQTTDFLLFAFLWLVYLHTKILHLLHSELNVSRLIYAFWNTSTVKFTCKSI